MADDQTDKTYDPTPHRRAEFRKQGRFARARDAGAVATAFATLLVLSEGSSRARLTALVRSSWGSADSFTQGPLFLAADGPLFAILIPTMMGSVVAAVLAGAAQAGVQFQTELVGWKPDRLNPLPRFQQMLSPKHALSEVGLAILKAAVVGGVAYATLKLEVPDLLHLSSFPVGDSVGRLLSAATRVLFASLLSLGGVCLVDYTVSRLMLEREMKMSRQELMDEAKAQDGDPKQKAKIRSRARALARKRSIANVKKADVIVTNPTHYAVALRYAASDAAPVVVAKGHDDVALRIRSEGRRHGVPIVENKPLARALYGSVELGHRVPSELFVAVARVLAFVYRMKQRGRGVRAA